MGLNLMEKEYILQSISKKMDIYLEESILIAKKKVLLIKEIIKHLSMYYGIMKVFH